MQFIDRFNGWHHKVEYTGIKDADWIDKCIVFNDNYISLLENKLDQRVMYSFVTIKCGDDKGLGFLLRTQDKVVCISCNHIFQKYLTEGKKITATSVYDASVSFPLKPIKDIKHFDYGNGVLAPVEDEIAILRPCWERHTHFDFSVLLSEEDFASDLEECVTQSCSFVGGVDAESFYWKSGLKLASVLTY